MFTAACFKPPISLIVSGAYQKSKLKKRPFEGQAYFGDGVRDEHITSPFEPTASKGGRDIHDDAAVLQQGLEDLDRLELPDDVADEVLLQVLGLHLGRVVVTAGSHACTYVSKCPRRM